MAEFTARGRKAEEAVSQLQLPGGPAEVRVAVTLDPAFREAASQVGLEAAADDLVEVELENGVVFWTSLQQLREDTAPLASRDAAVDELPTRYPQAGPAERGLMGIAIKVLRFLHFDVPKQGAKGVATRIEAKLAGDPGFYRIDARGELTADRIAAGSEPVLVFIHGTASSTKTAFRGLIEEPEQAIAWKALQDRYGGRIFGFEHRSLTESPVDNAVQFLEGLPGQNLPPLHLVSHSRGGLIGDLLAHGGLDVAFPESLLDAAEVDAAERKTFNRLNELLSLRAPTVARFVRVASPSGGTTLAARRLDIYLSILFRLLGMTPGVGPLLGGLGELVAAVAKERTDPEVLPGLAAQMPKSSLVRALNGSGRLLDSDLTVIAGDSDGFIKNLANLFYWHANDLVVDTRSMYRGTPRRERRWYLSEGSEVHHTNYFRRAETVEKMIAGLTRRDTDQAGFATSAPRAAVRGHVPYAAPEDNPEKSAVVLVPGVMGSHLAVTYQGQRNRIWLDLSDLMKGRIEQLAIGAAGFSVEPDGLVERAYGDFTAFLRDQGQHVILLDYDWRESIELAAVRLRDVIRRRLKVSSKPICLVAHSMGGLVARYLIAKQGEWSEWGEVVTGGGRLVQLGTPNGGSYLIPCLLLGEEKLLRRLAALDVKHKKAELVSFISRFPGLLELSPQTRDRDFFTVDPWADLEVLAKPALADLKQAKTVVDVLAGVDLAQHPVVYVAGKDDETPTMTPDAKQITFTARGDGRVTWDSGIPAGVQHWFVDAVHGSLADHKPAFQGLLDLVTQGKTQRLASEEPPPRRRRARDTGGPRGEEAEIFPTQQSLEAAALGMDESEAWEVPTEKVPTCTVEVRHGDLTYARFPVMVGHYAGDPILNAEDALDRRLGGVLSERHQLEIYPRAIGSHEIVLPDPSDGGPGAGNGGGALIVGLGDVGDLSPGGLARTIEEAIVRYVFLLRERARKSSPLADPVGVTSLLIGSGEAGLGLAQVLESILSGVRLANRRLAATSSPDEPGRGISHLEIVELYEDRALEAVHLLRNLPALAYEGFDPAPRLGRMDGGHRRASYHEPSGWWAPLEIESDPEQPGVLKFSAHGRRARVTEVPLPIQPELVAQLLRRPLASTSTAHRRLSETLFELLLPQRMKKSAADRRSVILVLDEGSAVYPWELMSDRQSGEQRPVGVDAGLLRKLKVVQPPDTAYTEEARILVVGDPPSTLLPLPGAQDEARHVAELFNRESWTVVRQIRSDPGSEKSPGQAEIDAESVISAAMTSDFRVLHLAGHGVYDPLNPKRSGMVVGGDPGPAGTALLLSPAEVAQMRLVPDLVFINCCHLGRIETTPPHLLAANLATQFIRGGVRAVVAAGWAVDDAAARTFARTLYEELFRGNTFGDAVYSARQSTFEAHRDSNTWAAYQCYGDPGYRLVVRPDDGTVGGGGYRDDFADPVEVAVELGNLRSKARCDKRKDAPEEVRKRLRALEEQIAQQGWADEGEISAGLARVYGELGDYEPAVTWYEKARASEVGAVTLTDMEQLANLRARHAASRVRDNKLAKGAAAREIRKSIDEMEFLLQLGETNERLSDLASAYKRLATFRSAQAPFDRDVERMAFYYARAAQRDPSDLYPVLNALSGIIALGGPWSEVPEWSREANPFATGDAFDRALQEARERAVELAEKERNFWSRTYGPDAELLAALRDDAPEARYRELAERYRALFRDFGSVREHDSVLDQLKFLAFRLKRPEAERAHHQAARIEMLIGSLRPPAKK